MWTEETDAFKHINGFPEMVPMDQNNVLILYFIYYSPFLEFKLSYMYFERYTTVECLR